MNYASAGAHELQMNVAHLSAGLFTQGIFGRRRTKHRQSADQLTVMIPVLSLKEFDGTSKSAFVEKLGTTYQQIGFVAIRDHGFPAELAAELHAAIAKFFTLPDEVKLRYHRADHGRRLYWLWQGACKKRWKGPQGILAARTRTVL